MSDPSTYWLTVMNVVLGIVVLVCCVAVAAGVMQEVVARRKKRATFAALDHEVADLVAGYGGHAFNVPGLGVTMADGGEPAREKDKR
jgi:hypothetical protein